MRAVGVGSNRMNVQRVVAAQDKCLLAVNGRKWIKFVCAAVNISLCSRYFTGRRVGFIRYDPSVDGAKCQSA